jgi:hypothetical protein
LEDDTMRTLILAALAALTVPAAGCRVFCDDYPSRADYAPPPVVVPAVPAPAATPPY